MMRIKEAIVVEGRSDERAVKRAVDAQVIITSGYGIKESTFRAIEEADRRCGGIIFTGSDFMGERIRERLKLRVPNAKHAYLSRVDATSEGDIGIENAKPEAILAALEKVRTWVENPVDEFTKSDLIKNGLEGGPGALQRRDKMGKLLGIGYGNGKQFLLRLNRFGVSREEFEKALTTIDLENGGPQTC